MKIKQFKSGKKSVLVQYMMAALQSLSSQLIFTPNTAVFDIKRNNSDPIVFSLTSFSDLLKPDHMPF